MPTPTIDKTDRDAPAGDRAVETREYVDASGSVEPREETGPAKRTLMERLEAWVSRLSTKNNFWRKICSWIWLPIAYRSGIKVQRQRRSAGDEAFTAILPFRRFNRNWYSAMAGAALLANSEIAGGMYVFDIVGSDYTVVCKELHYKFLRPCKGPALYRVKPEEDVEALARAGGEFNIAVEIAICQALKTVGKDRVERRVGRCNAVFHVTPKSLAKARDRKMLERERRRVRRTQR